MTDQRTPVERSMNDKMLNIMKGDGEGDGLTLTPAEATAFKLMMGAMHQRQVDTANLTIAQGVNRAMREAIGRQGFQPDPSGTLGWERELRPTETHRNRHRRQ